MGWPDGRAEYHGTTDGSSKGNDCNERSAAHSSTVLNDGSRIQDQIARRDLVREPEGKKVSDERRRNECRRKVERSSECFRPYPDMRSLVKRKQ